VAEGKGGGQGGGAFEILGRVEVDLAALKKSLNAAEREVRDSGDRLKRVWSEASTPKPSGGGGGGGPEDHPVVKSSKHAGQEFSHLARIVRELAAGPLAQLSPELGHVVGGMAAAARSARFYGAAIGAVIVAGVLVSEVLGQFLEAANKATEATLDAARALETLDFERSTASVKKMTEELAHFTTYMQQVSDTSGQTGGFQSLIADFQLLKDVVTGTTASTIKALNEQAKNQANVLGPLIEFPLQYAEAQKKAADITKQVSELAKTNARDQRELAAGYALGRKAIEDRAAAELTILSKKELKDRLSGQADIGRARESNAGPEVIANMTKALNERLRHYELDRAAVVDESTQKIIEDRDKESKAMAKLTADIESFTQKDIARDQKRVESRSATTLAIAKSEEEINKISRTRLGTVESAGALEVRLSTARANTLGPLVSKLTEVNAKYESQKRALEALVNAGTDVIKNQQELAELEKQHVEDATEAEEKLASTRADLAAKAATARRQREQEEVANEDKRFQHLVAMGRATVQEEMSRQRGAMSDPRRNFEDQQSAEEKLLALRKQYAEQYFKYYQDLGVNTWDMQIQSAKTFLSETVQGSTQWFQAVSKVAEVYQSIHDKGKSIAQQMLSIAGSVAGPNARIRPEDVPSLLARARERDMGFLSRGGTASQLSGALNNLDVYRQAQGTPFSQAFGAAMRDPRAQLAASLRGEAGINPSSPMFAPAGTTTFANNQEETPGIGQEAGGAKNSLTDLADAATQAADALREIAARRDAAVNDANASVGNVLNTEGGPRQWVQSGKGLTVAESGAQGRDLFLGGKRGPATTVPVQ
jgi:hypothetical protein